jgi:membrane protease YdiL (CAAX protease family)
MPEPIAVFSVIILGLVWMFIVGVLVLLRELPDPTKASIKRRLRLTKPINPRSGKASNVYLLWGLVAAAAGLGISELAFPIQEFMLSILPDGLVNDRADLFDAIDVGDYWVIALFLFASIFNYFLGEEFVFRGILLPKMEGVFGRADWLANGVLFALYHLHIMYAIPSLLLVTWINALAARYFRSTWVAVVGHGIEGIVVMTLVTLGVFGVGA